MEIPSIFLENIFWNRDIIKSISCHYLDQTKKIPDDLVDKLIGANEQCAALPILHLIYQSLYDLEIHSPPDRQTLESLNLAKAFNQIRKKVIMLDGPEVQGKGYTFFNGHTHFRALMGYGVGYYTYVT